MYAVLENVGVSQKQPTIATVKTKISRLAVELFEYLRFRLESEYSRA